MTYRRLTLRYAAVRADLSWPFDPVWESEQLRRLLRGRWRPDADVYETASTIEMTIDLAGVEDEDFEVQLFANALVIEGCRRLPAAREDAVYHAAGIRQGLFRVELPLPAPVDPERVEARYDRGLLQVTLAKAA
jgi:HSP20 family protein